MVLGLEPIEITFIPLEVVQAWRVLIWCAELSLIGSVIVFLPRAWRLRNRQEVMRRWTLSVSSGFFFFLVQSAWGQVYRWDEPLRLSGLPLTTVAMVFFLH